MGSIIRKELKLLLKGKGNFFFLLIMPMLFIVLFGSIFSHVANATLTVHYVDQDKSSVSIQFLDTLGKVDGFALKEEPASALQDRIQQIKDGQLDSLLVIPKGFGEQLSSGATAAKLEFYRDAAADTVAGPIESVLNTVSSAWQKQRVKAALTASGTSAADADRILQPPIDVQEVKENSDTFSMIDQVVPGYTVMFVFFIIMSMMRSFLGEKESGMLARLRSTPLRPVTYLLGMWIPFVATVLVQCVILLGFGHLMYGVNFGDLVALTVMVVCLAICGTGIGLAISLWIRGENQGRGITMLITLGGAALGGLWLPTQLMPRFAQQLGHFTPQYWAQQGFQDIMMRGAHLSDVLPSLGALLAFGAAGYLVALWRFPRFLRSAVN